MAETPAFSLMFTPDAAAIAAAVGRMVPKRENLGGLLPEVDAAIRSMRPKIAARVAGEVVYPDGKDPCPGGPNGDDIGAAKAHELDPAHCLLGGGPWVRPVLERNVACEHAGTDLVWADLIGQSQSLLRRLAASPPRITDTWEVKFSYFESVMILCNVVYQGMNIAPLWFETSKYLSGSYARWPGEVNPRPTRWRFAPRGTAAFAASSGIADEKQAAADAARRSFMEDHLADKDRWRFAFQYVWPDLPVNVIPRVMPTFYAQEGMGWAPWVVEESRYSKVMRGEIGAFAPGFFGANAGQGYSPYVCGWNDGTHSCNSFTGVGEGLAFSRAHRFALPDVAWKRISADPTQALIQAFSATDPRETMRSFFELTASPASSSGRPVVHATGASDPRGRLFQGRSFDRIFRLMFRSTPEPARTIDTVSTVWVPGGDFYVLRAQEWASYVGGLDVARTMNQAAISYLGKASSVVATLNSKGIRPDISVTEIETLISQLRSVESQARSATIGAVGSAAAAIPVGGQVLGVVAAIATIVTGGYLDFVSSTFSPVMSEGFQLLLQPLTLRSPSSDYACTFNTGAAGGAQRILFQFQPRLLGGGGKLWDLSQGRNPPPDFPPGSAPSCPTGGCDSAGKSKAPLVAAGVGVLALGALAYALL